MDENRLKSFLQRIPDVVKGWLGLIIAIAGIIIALRTDTQLYSVIIIGIILAIWLFIAVYIVRAHLPGTFSKRGPYRYESYRWAGFLSIGAVIGIIFAFSLFTPNRLYVYEAFVGTPTSTPSPTFIPFTASPTLTLIPSETPTLTPAATLTEMPIPTSTPSIIFYDNFSDTSNGWDLNGAYILPGTNATTNTTIIRGVLEYQMYCEPISPKKCQTWIKVPLDRKKNFDLSIDVVIKHFYYEFTNSTLVFFVKFRDASQDYIIKFSNDGYVSMYLNGTTPITDKPIFSKFINRERDETNSFRIVAQDTIFIIWVLC